MLKESLIKPLIDSASRMAWGYQRFLLTEPGSQIANSNDLKSINVMNRQRGFTLIEIMIVVAIVAIIASIAYPSYQTQVLKTRRADAHASLTDISARQERFMAQRNSYASNFGSTATGLGLEDTADAASTSSNDGFYTMTISNNPCGNFANCYTIIATANGAQANDDECASISLSSTGDKSSKNKSDVATNDCW